MGILRGRMATRRGVLRLNSRGLMDEPGELILTEVLYWGAFMALGCVEEFMNSVFGLLWARSC